MLQPQPLELWGGVECTVARIGNHFRDQSLETGHRDRIEDLDAIAAIGIRTLRYPVIWETVSPKSPDEADWSWHDERLARLQALGIRPIAGLCHHGSGPLYTNMLDPEFPELLARHAARVAERYPWIELYTPVNEPLTTARFSALYGHWYPHERNYDSFLRALVNECKATVLAMRAIRRFVPKAQLVQTDDFGKTFSTPQLAYQAEHENERRWLTFDLLCGRVDRAHPFWGWLTYSGVSESDLEMFLEADAAPDVIGINHYLTSERFLDQRLRHYPKPHWGENGRHRYADAEAVRVDLEEGDLGPAARLREIWERYRRPIAVTEAHHGCTRDEQLRWLMDVWNAAQTVRSEGADIRAVTIWSLFGTVDWNTLLTESNGIYEAGAFDVRGIPPRPTALAHASAGLAHHGAFDHPVLDQPGWWKRDRRFYRSLGKRKACRVPSTPRPILITGASGMLGQAFARLCDHRGLAHVLVGREELDIENRDRVEAALACHKPWAVIHAAGYANVASSEREPKPRLRENTFGLETLAQACARAGAPLVSFSTDQVFDGRLGRAYVESDQVNPGSVYGIAEAETERRVIAACPQALVVRAGAYFGPWDSENFIWKALNRLSRGFGVEARADVVSPTYVPDLVHVTLDLLIDNERGVWHLANPGEVSWRALAEDLAVRSGFDPALVEGGKVETTLNTALTSERGILLPSLESALDRFFRDSEIEWTLNPEIMSVAAE